MEIRGWGGSKAVSFCFAKSVGVQLIEKCTTYGQFRVL